MATRDFWSLSLDKCETLNLGDTCVLAELLRQDCCLTLAKVCSSSYSFTGVIASVFETDNNPKEEQLNKKKRLIDLFVCFSEYGNVLSLYIHTVS